MRSFPSSSRLGLADAFISYTWAHHTCWWRWWQWRGWCCCYCLPRHCWCQCCPLAIKLHSILTFNDTPYIDRSTVIYRHFGVFLYARAASVTPRLWMCHPLADFPMIVQVWKMEVFVLLRASPTPPFSTWYVKCHLGGNEIIICSKFIIHYYRTTGIHLAKPHELIIRPPSRFLLNLPIFLCFDFSANTHWQHCWWA